MDEISKSLMLKAQTCCVGKDYEKALEYYDTVIQRTKPGRRAPIEALDRRSAIYVQLRRFSEAFQDGKRMIREHKTDPRGYLRTASVLKYQAAEKGDNEYIQSAIKVARSGKQNADKSSTVLYKSLVRMFDDLSKASPSSGVDPATKLPLELFVQVLETLDRTELVRAFRVSKQWRNLISGTPAFWKQLSLRLREGTGNRVVLRTLDLAIRLATDSDRVCHLADFELHDDTGNHTLIDSYNKDRERCMLAVFKQATRLRSIRVSTTHAAGRRVLYNLDWSKANLPQLRYLQVKVKGVLGIDRTAGISTFSWMHKALVIFPKLTHLSVTSYSWAVFDGKDGESFEAMKWPTDVQLVSLCLTTDVSSEPLYLEDMRLGDLADAAPNLEEVAFDSVGFRSTEDPDSAAALEPDACLSFTRFANLKRLTLIWDNRALLMPTGKELEYLEIGGGRMQALDVHSEIGAYDVDEPLAPKLKTLRLGRAIDPGLWAHYLQHTGGIIQHLVIPANLPHPAGDNFTAQMLLTSLFPGDSIGQLETIVIKHAAMFLGLDNAFATWLAKSAPALKSITFEGEISMNGAGMHTLATRLSQLCFLDVGKAANASMDIIPFFRSRGITLRGVIGNQNERPGKRGKTVRYG